MGKGYRAFMPSLGVPLSSNLHTFINPETLLPCLWGFMEALSHSRNLLNLWPLAIGVDL